MYNKDLKNKFIESISNNQSKELYRFLFQSTEKMETENGKDLYLFNKEEALKLFSSYELLLPALSAKKSAISRYVDWNTLLYGGINYFSIITADDLRKVSVCPPTYLNLSDVDKLAAGLKNSCDKIVLYLFFYGIDAHELSKIRTQHIDLKNNTLYTKERRIVVPRYILDLIIDSCETYRYYSENDNIRTLCYPLSLQDNSPIKPRAQAKNRGLDTVEHRIRDKMVRIRKLTGNGKISRQYLRDSGIIYHIKKIMEINNLDEEEVFTGDWLDSVKYQYKIKYSNRNLKFKYKEMII